MLLAGDLGGTRARLALAPEGAAPFVFERVYADAAFSDFEALLAHFLEEARQALGTVLPTVACIGVAGPVERNRVRLTNRPWTLDGDALARRFGLRCLRLVNDFLAAASAIEALAAGDLRTLQPGLPDPARPRVVLGAGTGLGVALAVPMQALPPAGVAWRVVPGEGGHVGFAAETPEQSELVEWLRAREGRVSREHLLSGAGLERIHAFLAARGGTETGAPGPDAARITALAGQGEPQAQAALALFLRCYGQVAGDLALSVLARGGVFIAGGIAPRLPVQALTGPFMDGFLAKGPWRAVLGRMPVHLVTAPQPGLRGAALLASQLQAARTGSPGAGAN